MKSKFNDVSKATIDRCIEVLKRDNETCVNYKRQLVQLRALGEKEKREMEELFGMSHDEIVQDTIWSMTEARSAFFSKFWFAIEVLGVSFDDLCSVGWSEE